MCAGSVLFTVLDVLRMQNSSFTCGCFQTGMPAKYCHVLGSMEWRLKPTIQHDVMQLLVLVTWVAGYFKDLVLLKITYFSMCIQVHTILYIWSRFTDGFIYSICTLVTTWGTCSLPLSLMEQSSVHVRIRLNGREPYCFLKQQTHRSPSTFNRPTQNCPPSNNFLMPLSIFKRNKNHLPNHWFSGGPLKFLSWHT